ncbi:MAG: acetylglutamate kinase [Alphaproteobacteria bacterium]|nr:acetylglutamate kinase [Alphaproteobacteria bacterium]
MPARPDPDKLMETARTLAEALPYMRAFNKQTFVVKFGGHAMGDDALARSFAADIVLLKQVGINPVVVHGGGPQIGKMLERLNIKSSFVDGLRITDAPTVEVVEMVLAGTVNKQIVSSISAVGGVAVGLSGKDANLISARRMTRTTRDPDSNIEKVLDLGFVGEPTHINPHVLRVLEQSDIIPVIAPTGLGDDGHTYNINADTAAGAIAGALKASKLIMLTDVAGVLDKQGNLIERIDAAKAKALLADGTIRGGMIPKLETCLEAVQLGARAAHILDGRVAHVLLLEVFTAHGVGTMITA